ncbi:probable serine/threonine-protein kinase PBL25 [Cucurbita pepo subsp. pepo]|uniref:probable serine/threonine-protein kinase PBL25 n=1 Tax=Cucurbita pepo subsp. pepo TaxID=3664 RepID=UPI000C9D736F|nr:probable serine/threonine-protein kinase PBL25 [Cucurbita pepo subsp. pepo]
MLSLVKTKSAATKKRTIIVGLNSANSGREILLRMLVVVVRTGDNVVAVHVREPNENFNPNTFHIHEDLCKSKQVDFQVRICEGESYILELTHQVRLNFATILVLGTTTLGPKDSVVKTCLKGLPPTCTLMVMDNRGKIQVQMKGTSQEGSTRPILKAPLSSSAHHSPNPLTESSSSSSSSSSSPLPSVQPEGSQRPVPTFAFEKLSHVDLKHSVRLFTPQEIAFATKNFSPVMLIGEGVCFKMYSAKLEDGQFVAVKVQTKQFSSEVLLREIEMLAGLRHENIVKIVGCCNREEIRAVVYNQLKGNLMQHLGKLKWTDRVQVAIGVAKALKYLHHSCSPPIIHRNIKSSNILLSDQCQPQLSDFGEAMVLQEVQEDSTQVEIGRFGYLAPEYLMIGKVNEKVDVYSYGVVLLELITGKDAIQTEQTNRRSLVFWARSLLGCNLAEHLIDPNLKEDYNHEVMEMMMIVARLCLLHSSSRRPTMETIVKLFEEPEYLKKMQSGRKDLLTVLTPKAEIGLWKNEESALQDTTRTDQNYGFSDNLNVT